MKFTILPIIVFLTVIAIVTIKKHYSQPKKAELNIEQTQPNSQKDGPLVNDVIIDFVKRQLLQAVDGTKEEALKHS